MKEKAERLRGKDVTNRKVAETELKSVALNPMLFHWLPGYPGRHKVGARLRVQQERAGLLGRCRAAASP